MAINFVKWREGSFLADRDIDGLSSRKHMYTFVRESPSDFSAVDFSVTTSSHQL